MRIGSYCLEGDVGSFGEESTSGGVGAVKVFVEVVARAGGGDVLEIAAGAGEVGIEAEWLEFSDDAGFFGSEAAVPGGRLGFEDAVSAIGVFVDVERGSAELGVC